MNGWRHRIRDLVTLFAGLGLALASAHAQSWRLAQTIALPGVTGRIDHLSIDPTGQRLFVAALGNNTVEVVDLKGGTVARSLRGFAEPQGVLFVAELNRLYVANGGDGSLRVLDGTSLAEVARVKFDDDADNVRYDAAAKQVLVGYGSGALGMVDATTNQVVGKIALSSHPESFQLEKNGGRVFVNVPRSHEVVVADRTTKKIIGKWSLGLVAANFPLALDEANQRAFVACRTPARLLVFDTISGREIAKLDLHGDCDDVFYDAARKEIHASCGEGFIDTFAQDGPDAYALKQVTKTVAKARTCLFVGGRIFLAVPRQSGSEARVQVYESGL